MTDPSVHNGFLTVFQFPEKLSSAASEYLWFFYVYLELHGFASNCSLQQSTTDPNVALEVSIIPPDVDATTTAVQLLKDYLELADAPETALPPQTEHPELAEMVRNVLKRLHERLLRMGWTSKADLSRYILRQTVLAVPSDDDLRYAHTYAGLNHRDKLS